MVLRVSGAEILHRLSHPSGRLFLQLIVVLLTARLFFLIFSRLRQPAVVGEVLAGIALGPTLLGALAPEFHAFLFPPRELGALELLSELGIVLFLFLVGTEVDLDQLRDRLAQSAGVSLGGTAVSFALGAAAALLLYNGYAEGRPVLPFALFLGTAMSITAFPVLARILRERELSTSPVGVVALAAAAVGDVLAWCMLALVVGLVQSQNVWGSVAVSGAAVAFACFMLFLVRPLFARMGRVYVTREVIGRGVMTATVIILLISALISQAIGIHALFGAFLAGAVLPRGTRFRAILVERIEDFVSILLLPVFFALTGLRLDLGFLLEPGSWNALGLILGAAIVGKVVGSALPARLLGLGWREAGVVGFLMNTRGLVEIILLNVGHQIGILPSSVFAMMVVMALVTTFMTGPVLSLLERPSATPEGPAPAEEGPILVPFGPPESGRLLVRVAALFSSRVRALHVSPLSDTGLAERHLSRDEVFGSIAAAAEENQTELQSVHRATADLAGTIALEANLCHAPLVLIGSARTLFAADVLGGRVADLLRRVPRTLGVFVDRRVSNSPQMAVVWTGDQDDALLSLVARSRADRRERLLILDLSAEGAVDRYAHNHRAALPDAEFLAGEPARTALSRLRDGDLVLLSTRAYAERIAEVAVRGRRASSADDIPCSLLIVRPARA